MASASSSAPNYALPWDVFLSYRGPDTGPTFTGHLYAALDRHGIHTYKDDYKLRMGEVISDTLRDTIKTSKIYIVVFSLDYATSPWCLDELVDIVKFKRTEKRLIIPVFHNINPSIVRHVSDDYGKALQVHEEGYYKDQKQKVVDWRDALKEAANVSGEHVCEKNREETDVIEKIVAEILPRINPKGFDEKTVGLDARVDSIAAMLRSEDPASVTKIGIYGMGGVGKTTLARAVFTRIYLQFDGSSFLADVTANSDTKNGMKSLQQQLLNDILLQSRNDVNDVVQGEYLIKSKITNKRILVVIDDLNHSYQHKSLGVESFAHGSVVIITTRQEDVLADFGVKTEHRYMVNQLDPIESLALFKQHAFGFDAKPDNALMELSNEILSYADGLPLALEVFGSVLRTKYTVEEWRDFIEIVKETPNKDIHNRLLISFNAIDDDPQVKKMFLDVACFFVGWPKERLFKVLETYYSYVNVKINNLKKRCLLTFNHRDVLQMHDLLRDMGREVARNNSPDEPEKHSRLWTSKVISEVLSEEDEETKAIEGIFYDDESEASMEESLATKTFIKMKKLRFLHLRGLKNLTGSFDQTFKNLRWLCWYHCPFLPPEFKPLDLGMLELQHSNMRTVKLDRVFKHLKTLDMSFSFLLLATPDFTMLPNLVTLNLVGCARLKEVHRSIGSLAGLVSLVLKGCGQLASLPDTIGHLKALEILNVSMTSLVELPKELGNITSLKVLDMHATSVLHLPDSIGYLNNLIKLILSYNCHLKTLPDTICNLRSLEVLKINGCKNLEELPDQMQKITSLRKLISSDTAISKVELSQIPLSLIRLDFSKNVLTALPSGISQLSKLEYLNINFCEKLLYIEELPPNLIELEASFCPSMISFRIQADMKHLEILNLEFCGGLKEIQGLEYFTSLKNLDLGGCCSLLSTEALLPNLEWINFRPNYKVMFCSLTECPCKPTEGILHIRRSPMVMHIRF